MNQKNAPNQWNDESKSQKKAGKLRARKRKVGHRGKGRTHQKAPDPWQENYERLRLVLGSLIESQGGEIKVSIALCEQYDVTKVLHVNDDDDGNYVLTLEKPLGAEKPDEREMVMEGGEQEFEVRVE